MPRLLALATLTGGAVFAQAPAATTKFTGDLGYVSATGNTRLTTLSIGEKLVHSRGRWTLTLLGAHVYGKNDSVETANQVRAVARADFDFLPRLGVFGGAAYERNAFAGFFRRTDENVGLRWKAIVAPMDSMSVDAGGGMTQQVNVDGTDDAFSAARFAVNYRHFFSTTAYFQELAEYIPNLETSGAYRVNSESSVVAPISAHIGIKVSYSLRYDSKPPATFGTTDRVLTMGIQLTF